MASKQWERMKKEGERLKASNHLPEPSKTEKAHGFFKPVRKGSADEHFIKMVEQKKSIARKMKKNNV